MHQNAGRVVSPAVMQASGGSSTHTPVWHSTGRHASAPPLSPACPANSYYPPESITIPYSAIEAAVGLTNVVAAPLAAGLLTMDGVMGMRGWQW